MQNKFILITLFVLTACASNKKMNKEEQADDKTVRAVPSEKVDYMGAPTIVYKTTNDYTKNVPVTLSDDKTKIVSYPAPTDVFYKGVLAYPFQLGANYLLDNRGITPNSAYTKYTYEEYSKLKTAPDLETLYKAIIDKNPFTEIYNCGNRNRFKDEVTELTEIIRNEKFKDFKRIK